MTDAAAVALCCMAASAGALTIVPTFDKSISGNATAGPAMKAAINGAIHVFESNYTDNFSINITFKVDTSVGLGQSEVSYATVTYAHYLTALKSKATSANDFRALSHLPATSTDPVVGGADMLITAPLANMLGLSAQSPNGSTISFNTNIMNFSRPNPNDDYFDLQSVMEHEIDEVLGGGGAGCNIGAFSQIGALDLFRFSTNSANRTLARTWISTGDNAYFSVDGTNLWARFNMEQGGDLGDFWGFDQDANTFLPLYWNPPGVTPHAEVQDAYATASFFSYPANFTHFPTTNYYYENTSPDLATNELTMLDVIGWTLANLQSAPPAITVAKSGSQKITISWPTNATGYTLQETTNLHIPSWVASASGTKNPASITTTNVQKFYRLEAPKPAVEQAELAEIESATSAPVMRPLRVGILPGDARRPGNTEAGTQTSE